MEKFNKLEHENLLKFRDFIIEENQLYLFYDYKESKSLISIIANNNLIKLKDCVMAIGDALVYLHENQIYHPFLSFNDIFISDDQIPYIINYSMDCLNIPVRLPQELKENTDKTKIDSYIFGIFVFELFTKIQYSTVDLSDYKSIVEKHLNDNLYPPELIELIISLLNQDEKERITIDDFMESEFIRSIHKKSIYYI